MDQRNASSLHENSLSLENYAFTNKPYGIYGAQLRIVTNIAFQEEMCFSLCQF